MSAILALSVMWCLSGAVYDGSDPTMNQAFQIAVDYVNQNASDETRVVLRSRQVGNVLSTFDYIQQGNVPLVPLEHDPMQHVTYSRTMAKVEYIFDLTIDIP